jgi:hypothetical protein
MIQELLKKHETYKSKGMRLNADDLFERNQVLESLLDLRVEKRSELFERKNELDNKKAIRRIELKDEKDDAGKKKHTENTIDSILMQEFQEQDKEYLLKKAEIEMIENKCQVIPEYINL